LVGHVGFIERNYFPYQMGLSIDVRYELSIHENHAFRSFSFSTLKKFKKRNDEK